MGTYYENIYRGQVYWVDFSMLDMGCVQRGIRPAIIVSNQLGCIHSHSLNVVPLSTKIEKECWYQPLMESMRSKSIALCGQITTIDKDYIRSLYCVLSEEDMEKVEKGILVALGMNEKDDKEEKELGRGGIEELRDALKNALDRIEETLGIGKEEKLKERAYKRGSYVKLDLGQTEQFIKDWESGKRKTDVAQEYGFSTYGSALQYYRRKKREMEDGHN